MRGNRRQYKIDEWRDGQPEGHFYASSLAEWRVGRDPHKLVADMRRAGQGTYSLPFSLWYVPLSLDVGYKIEGYAPKVEGSIFVASYGRDSL